MKIRIQDTRFAGEFIAQFPFPRKNTQEAVTTRRFGGPLSYVENWLKKYYN